MSVLVPSSSQTLSKTHYSEIVLSHLLPPPTTEKLYQNDTENDSPKVSVGGMVSCATYFKV